MTPRVSYVALAGTAALLSAAVAAVGVVFLVLMYVGFLTPVKGLLALGPLNDVCVLVQYALALPVVGALDGMLAPLGSVRRHLLFAAGMMGCLGAVVFQALLLLGVMSFQEQVGYAAVSVLLAGLWVVLASIAARRFGALHVSSAVLIGAGLYFGYPVWAFRVSQQLRARAS